MYYYYFLLYNIVLVLPYINMHPPQVYMCSPSWTPLPLSSPYHPSGSSSCTSPKLPVSCIKPGLAIHFLYDIIHVLMPFSKIIPPTLSHRVQKTVLYICVSFAVSHTGLFLPFSKFHIYALVYCIGEKAMATHSSTLALKIPWMEEPGGLPSMGSHRVGHDWSDLAAAYCIGVFLSGLLHSIIGSSFIHLIRTESNVFFLMAE